MGPFVPEFISNELNLMVAFVVGIAFGFVLEQAGFSSSRRLAGQFYGYDFTVLRVFFSAGLTAMSGVLILGWAGLLDLDMIYVNPTWLWPAVVGGLIMGVGFVIGGYCPGTSVCAVAIGKIDAMWFIGGSIIGIFLYGEFFSFYKDFHVSSALGPIKIYETLGMSPGVFALILIGVAVAAFAGTSMLERKINHHAPSRAFPRREHRYAMAALLVVAVLLVFLPDRKTRTIDMVQKAEYRQSHPVEPMDVDEFAFRLVDNDPRMTIIDLRPSEQFRESPLPGSISASLKDLFGKELLPVLSRRHTQKVFVADDPLIAEHAYYIAHNLGFENLRVLTGGLNAFRSVILNRHGIENADRDTRRFRERAGAQIPNLMTDFKNRANRTPKVQKKIQGGC